MKKLIFTAILAISALVANATVRTVSNDPAGGAQYPTLETAYNASTNGDTLLIEGTNIPYYLSCNNPWNKSITLIGIGINTQKQNPRRTVFRQIDCYNHFTLYPNASGSRFYGIDFTNGVYMLSGVSNLTFENCRFGTEFNFGGQSGANYIFKNCVFDRDNDVNIQYASSTSTPTNIMISNCVFDGYIQGNGNPYATILIDHSLFLSTSTGSFSGLTNPVINNSIFMNFLPGGVTNGTWMNNMCRVTGIFPPGTGGNTGSGNISNTNPNFVTYTLGSTYSTAFDFHLQAGSLAILAGSDGTDIGPHGGSSGFSEKFEVLGNPVMRSVLVNNPFINSNGTLNVQINASKPYDN